MQVLSTIVIFSTLTATVLGACDRMNALVNALNQLKEASDSSSCPFSSSSSSGSIDDASPVLVQSDAATVASAQPTKTNNEAALDEQAFDYILGQYSFEGPDPVMSSPQKAMGLAGGPELNTYSYETNVGDKYANSVLSQIPDGQVQSPKSISYYGIPDSFENFDSYTAYDEPTVDYYAPIVSSVIPVPGKLKFWFFDEL